MAIDNDIMTPTNPSWPAFIGQLEAQIEEDGKGCVPHHWRSRILLKKFGCDAKASIAYFKQHGGHCDCEVVVNVEDSVKWEASKVN